jgi:hypothetical protein
MTNSVRYAESILLNVPAFYQESKFCKIVFFIASCLNCAEKNAETVWILFLCCLLNRHSPKNGSSTWPGADNLFI